MAVDIRRSRGRPRDPAVTPKVLQAAREIVAEVGLRNASMSAIADRAGVGKPTVYLRWPNLMALVDAAIEDLELTDDELARFDEAHEALEALIALPAGRFLFEASLRPSGQEAVRRRTRGG